MLKSLKLPGGANEQPEVAVFVNGSPLSPRADQTPKADVAARQKAAEALDALCSTDLANLVSKDAIIPPSTPDEISAWRFASDLIHTLNSTRASGQALALKISIRALEALELALQPLLQPSEEAELSADELPSPGAVRAMASLAAQAAVWAHDDGAASAKVMESMLQCAEQCTALGAECGARDPAGQYALQLALASSRSLHILMAKYPCSPHIVIEDAAARMHVLLMASARLAEAEWTSATAVDENTPCDKKILELWMWDLDKPVDDSANLMEESPAHSLTKVWTEAAAVLLGAAWCSQPSEVRSAFIPLAIASSEKESVLLLLGRLLAVVGGEESASQLLIPVVTDTLAARTGDLDAGVYGVAAHVLASMAATCASSDNLWGYTQVVDLLIKLYKFPQFSISAALLHGAANVLPPRPVEQQMPSGSAAMLHTVGEVRISGRCPGGLARALTRLAKGLSAASLRYRRDFRRRILALFSDFSLLLPNESFVMDLGSLLPAVAAALVGLTDHKHESKRSSMMMSSGELSLDALSSMQAEGRALNAALRHLWLYSSVYDFACLLNSSLNGSLIKGKGLTVWPVEWAAALSTIAAATPALLLGSEQQKAEAFLEDVAAEYGSWLSKLGPKAEAEKLMNKVIAVAGTPPNAGTLTAPMAAHVLTIAYKAICEATFQHIEHPVDCCPLEPVLTHMQFSPPAAAEYPWLKETLAAAFSVQVKRLSELSVDRNQSDAAYAARAVERTAEVLALSLGMHGPNTDVAQTAATLSEDLVGRFPALLFSNTVFAATMQAVAEQSGAPHTLAGSDNGSAGNGNIKSIAGLNTGAAANGSALQRSLPMTSMLYLVNQAAVVAPGPAEALVLELLRHLGARGGRHADIAMQFTAEVMQALHSGRQICTLPDLCGTFKGLIAWSVKMHSLGTIAGLAAAEEDGVPVGGGVVTRCASSLLSAIRDGSTDAVLLYRIVDAAAAVVRNDSDPAVPPILKLLAWTPLSRVVPEVMAACAMSWHWLLTVGSASLKSLLLEEITEAWIGSRDGQLGLFDLVNAAKESTEEHDVSSQLAAIRAHHAWVVFFIEVWRAQRHDSSAGALSLRATFGRMLDAALGGVDSSPLSLHPAAVGARFRLLQLALSFVCAADRPGPAFPDAVSRIEFYRRIILTALGSFNAPVSWYESDRESLRETATALQDFMLLLKKAPNLVGSKSTDPAAQTLRKAMEGPATALLMFLLPLEHERLSLWADPVPGAARRIGTASLSSADWPRWIVSAWEVSPHLGLSLGSRFSGIPAVTQQLEHLVTRNAADSTVQSLPEAVKYLATPAATAANAPVLTHLAVWAPVNLLQAMSIISSPAGRHPVVADYVIRSLDRCDPEEVAFFLPQLVQLLRNDPDGKLENFLVETANDSVYFAYLLVCQLDSEGTPPEEAFNPAVKRSNWSPPEPTGLWEIADRVRQRLWSSLHGQVKEQLEAQLQFFSDVTNISGKLYPVPKEERKAAAVKFVKEVIVPRNDLFMPTDLHAKIVRPKPESASPMQSAAKCPILVAFDVEKERTDGGACTPAVEAAIFKVGDDCRQDVLALQVIELLKRQFDNAALNLPLVPYGVIPTGHECGIIEVVPHAKSRAQLGELTDGGLFEVFQREFGLPGSPRFEAARAAFIASSAAYAVASYLLQAKDRHNGNIMIDNRGRIIHIDFGYILGISPGGNMGFESAAFKLSYEMTELLDPGNTRTSPYFLRFQELCVKGYLAARSAADGIVATVAMAEASRLPCFQRGNAIESLRERFHLELSDAQAAEFMRGLIVDAYDKWTTGVYDLIQYYQNRIPK